MLLTEDERLLQDSVREFVQKEALPKMAECAELQGPWPIAMGLWPRMAELGYIGISTPEEMGGFGLSVKKELLVCEAIAQAGSLGIN